MINGAPKGKILVIAGTREGREIAVSLAEKGFPVMASVASTYGADFLRHEAGVSLQVGMLDKAGFDALITQNNIKCVVNAAHPYAVQVSKHAGEVSAKEGIPYLRYLRPATVWPDYNNLVFVDNFKEAAHKAAGLGKVLFLTVGMKNIAPFINEAKKTRAKIIARVLPTPESIGYCLKQGLAEEQIITGHGPFTKGDNIKALTETGAQVMVTKDSGLTGGAVAKIEAAMELGIPVVVVTRPEYNPENNLKLSNSLDDILREVEQIWKKE